MTLQLVLLIIPTIFIYLLYLRLLYFKCLSEAYLFLLHYIERIDTLPVYFPTHESYMYR